MRQVYATYVARRFFEAFGKISFVTLVLVAMAPIFEILGYFSVTHIASNMPREYTVIDLYSFFVGALSTTEVMVQVVTFLALIIIGFISFRLVRNVISYRRILRS